MRNFHGGSDQFDYVGADDSVLVPPLPILPKIKIHLSPLLAVPTTKKGMMQSFYFPVCMNRRCARYRVGSVWLTGENPYQCRNNADPFSLRPSLLILLLVHKPSPPFLAL